MPFYMFKARYTAEAIKAMVEHPQDREAPARKLVESVGGKLHHLFFCFDRDDIVALLEGPDDQSAAAASMIIGASGAFSGGATTKLMTCEEAMRAMTKAKAAMASYRPPTA